MEEDIMAANASRARTGPVARPDGEAELSGPVLSPHLRENIIEAVAQIIDPVEWDFCDGNGRKKYINSVPRWQRQIWCRQSMAKARKIVSLCERGL